MSRRRDRHDREGATPGTGRGEPRAPRPVDEAPGDAAAPDDERFEPDDASLAPDDGVEIDPLATLADERDEDADWEPDGPPRRRRHRLGSALALLVFACVAFGTGLFVFNSFLMPRLIHSTGEVKVPDLSNLTLEQAEQLVRPLGLQLSRAGERFDPSVPSGFVLSQDPAPETPVRGKRRVMVMLSLGEEFSSVPEVFGESLRGARLLIERAGLTVGGVTRAPSEDVGDDLVIATDPPAESVLPRNTAVALLVSTGQGVEQYVMPDLLGREIGSVRRQLEALGFRVLVPPAGASVGPIVFQDPGAGARITRDATVMLQATGRMIR